MAWVRLESGVFEHPKLQRASGPAMLLWLASIAWCNRATSDGRIPPQLLRRLAFDAKIEDPVATDEAVDELVRLRLWDEGDGAWWVHDYAVYQPTRDRLAHTREMTRLRVRRWREAHPGQQPPPDLLADERNAVTPTGNDVTVTRPPSLPPKAPLAARHSAINPVALDELRARRAS